MNPNKTNQERYETGIDTLQTIVGDQGIKLIKQIGEFFPDLEHTLVAFGFGDLYSRGVLDLRQREMITLTALITQGMTEQLPFHIHASLNVGMMPEEILEVVLQCGGYAGFPRAVSAIHVVQKVFQERGITMGADKGTK